jgi:hypothetical protein
VIIELLISTGTCMQRAVIMLTSRGGPMYATGNLRVTCEGELSRCRAWFGPLLLMQQAEMVVFLTLSNRKSLCVGDSSRYNTWMLSYMEKAMSV